MSAVIAQGVLEFSLFVAVHDNGREMASELVYGAESPCILHHLLKRAR